MKWAWWLGGGSIAAVALVAALYALGLGGVARVLQSVLGALGDAAQSARQWLQRPGNKTRGSCAVFALLFLAAGLQSWQRGTVIVQQRADYVLLKQVSEHEKRVLAEKLSDHKATIERFAELSRQQMALLELARQDNADALAIAEAAQERASQSERLYQEAFMQKPPECAAALQVMASACPSLRDY